MSGHGNPSSDRQVSDLRPPSMSTPRPSEVDVEALSDLSALIRDYLIDEVGATFPGFHATALTSRIASDWLATRDAEHERDVAAMDRMNVTLAETVRLHFARAEAAERALADLRGEIKAELTSEDAHAVLYGVIGTHPESYGGVTKDEALERAGALIERLRALLPRDDTAGAGGAG